MNAVPPIRVLVVDDSATVRAVLRRICERDPGLEVVGEAADGVEAVDIVAKLAPDVVLLDIEMPRMDGYAATERIMAEHPTPILILTARARRDHLRTAFEAVSRGAREVLPKPQDPEEWDRLAETLPRLLRGVARTRRRSTTLAGVGGAAPRRGPVPLRLIAIGSSTGGPGALRELLLGLGRGISCPVVVVQHIAAGFEQGLAEWLARDTGLSVRVARGGELPAAGEVLLAPAGAHLVFGADRSLRLDRATPPLHGHRPSVDIFLHSCALQLGKEAAGVVLSGMGSDGAEGLGAMRRAGAITLVQSEESAVIFGMPRVALETGAAEVAMAPREIGECLLRLAQEGGR